MKKYIALLLIYSLSSCNLLLDNDDRLEGHSAANPIISFKKYYMKEYRDYGMQPSFWKIDTLNRFDTLFLQLVNFIVLMAKVLLQMVKILK